MALKRNIKFPLVINGFNVRTLEELKENFRLKEILTYYLDGKLLTWLEQRFYNREAEFVKGLLNDKSLSPKEIISGIIEIFYVEVEENEVDEALRAFLRETNIVKMNKSLKGDIIIEDYESVAFDQHEFKIILEKKPSKIYLFGENFELTAEIKDVEIIGLNRPVLKINSVSGINLYTSNLKLLNLNIQSKNKVNIIGNAKQVASSTFTNIELKDVYNNLAYVKPIEKKYPFEFYFFGGFDRIKVFENYIVVISQDNLFFQILNANGEFIKNIYHCRYDRSPKSKSDLVELILSNSNSSLFYTQMFDINNKRGLYKIDSSSYKDISINYEILNKGASIKHFDVYKDIIYMERYMTMGHIIEVFDINKKENNIFTHHMHWETKRAYFSNGSFAEFKSDEILVGYKNEIVRFDNEENLTSIVEYYFNPNTELIYFTLYNSSYIYMYDLNTAKFKKKFKPNEEKLSAVYFNDNYLITLSWNGELKYWDIENLTLIDKFFIGEEYRKNSEKYPNVTLGSIDANDDSLIILFDDKLFCYKR